MHFSSLLVWKNSARRRFQKSFQTLLKLSGIFLLVGLVWLIGLFSQNASRSQESHKHKMNYILPSYAPTSSTRSTLAVDSAKREKIFSWNLLRLFWWISRDSVVANYSSWPVIIGVEQFCYCSSLAHLYPNTYCGSGEDDGHKFLGPLPLLFLFDYVRKFMTFFSFFTKD